MADIDRTEGLYTVTKYHICPPACDCKGHHNSG